jgi:hypothetical protein
VQCTCATLSSTACPPLRYFSTLSHNRHDFQNISHSKKNRVIYDQKLILIFTYSIRYSCPNLMKLEFSTQTSDKWSNIKVHKNPSSGSRVLLSGQIDKTKAFAAIRNYANTLKFVKINCYGDWKITALNRSKLLSELHEEQTCLLLYYE